MATTRRTRWRSTPICSAHSTTSAYPADSCSRGRTSGSSGPGTRWHTELPADRRQLWQNPLTNEANFGLLAMDPGVDGPPVVIDGTDDGLDPGQLAGDPRVARRGARGEGHPRRVLPVSAPGARRGRAWNTHPWPSVSTSSPAATAVFPVRPASASRRTPRSSSVPVTKPRLRPGVQRLQRPGDRAPARLLRRRRRRSGRGKRRVESAAAQRQLPRHRAGTRPRTADRVE